MRELQRTTLLAVVYVFIAAIVLSPICNYAHLDSALYLGDVRFIAWTLAWDNHFVLDLLADRLRDGGAAAALHSYFDANIFYPTPQALALNEHLFGLSLFTLPTYALTRNPAFAYNIAWLCSFPASALAMHWLAWRYTRDHLSALLAGAIYAFSFFKMLHGGGHLHLVWTFWIPLALLLLAWWWDRPRWLTAVAFGIVVTLQILSSWYIGAVTLVSIVPPARFALIVTIAVALLAASGAASWQARWKSWRGRLLTLAILALALSESFIVASPLGRPQPVPIPPMYRHLATLPAGPIVSLPGYRESDRWWLRADYEYYSTAHWHPIVNGYSRLDPPDHFWIMGHMTAFPGPNSAKTMRRLGVAYVVLHADQYPDGGAALLAEARTSADYALMHRIGETYLFRVQPASNAGQGE